MAFVVAGIGIAVVALAGTVVAGKIGFDVATNYADLRLVRPLTEAEKERVLALHGNSNRVRSYFYVVRQDCVVKFNGTEYTIKGGFLTDGASFALDHVAEEEWLLHDWLYANHRTLNVTKAEADAALRQTHRWLAVRIFAGKSFDNAVPHFL